MLGFLKVIHSCLSRVKFIQMGTENKLSKSKNFYNSCLAYSGLIAIKIGIQRSENWWFLIYLGIILVCIALFDIASEYEKTNLPKTKNFNYLLKYTKKRFQWTLLNSLFLIFINLYLIIWGYSIGFWGIFLILFGIIFGCFELINIAYAIEIKGACESKDPYDLLDYARKSLKYAEKSADKAWEYDPNDDKCSECKEFLLKALEYDPNEGSFYRQLAFLYSELGELELSNHYFEIADKIDPDEDELFYEKGKLKRRRKN